MTIRPCPSDELKPSKAPITDDERRARRRATDTARDDVCVSGYSLSPAIEAITERYVAGEIDSNEFVAAIRRSTEAVDSK